MRSLAIARWRVLTASEAMSLPLTALRAMSLDLTEFLPCRATAEPVRAAIRATIATSSAGEGRRLRTLLHPENLPCRSLGCRPPAPQPADRTVSFGARMRVWVDCTAAAHPLVLRPIVERLASARPRGRGHRPRVRADRRHPRAARDRARGVGRHAGGSTAGKGVALARRSAALARWARARRFDLALAHGSVDLAVVALAAADPDRADAGLRVGGPAAEDQLARRAPGDRARRDPGRPARARRCPAGEAFRYPGPEGGLLPRRLRARPGRCSTSSGSTATRVLAVVRPPPETSAYHQPNPLYERVLDRLAADAGATAVVIPRTGVRASRPRARRGLAASCPTSAIDAQSLIAYRRPRRQRRRDDEPRGGRARDARATRSSAAAWAPSTSG